MIGTVDAYRRYRGLILQLNKRFTNRWQANVSYVLSKSEGTVDNTFGGNSGSSRVFENPSLILVNREGPLRNDRRHEIKVYATYSIPGIDLNLNAIYRGLSGRNWFP